MLSYLFWPNPPAPAYSSPKVLLVLLLCAFLVAASFGLKRWRNKQSNAVTRKLSRSWSVAALWFGLVGLFMVICRVEGISYLSMRVWWFVWMIAFVLYVVLQIKLFRARHYEVIPQEKREEDDRDKYLPKKKRK